MKNILFSFLLCALMGGFAFASAETGWCDMPYTLHIEENAIEGICRIPEKIPGQMQELRAQGMICGREDAIRVFSILGEPVPQPHEFHISREKSYNYLDGDGDITKDRFVGFGTAMFAYNLRDDRMDRYWSSAPSWVPYADQSKYTDVSVNLADGIDWQSNSYIQGTGFKERIREIYAAVESLGYEAYAPIQMIYFNAETLQRNLERDEELFNEKSGFAWRQEDAVVRIEIALGLDDVRIKPYGVGTPDGTVNPDANVTAYMTENEVLYLYVGEGLYEKKESASVLQDILTPEEVVSLYETYLSQVLQIKQGMETIRLIALEYNIRYKEQAGNFSPEREIVPVWSVYTEYEDLCPTVMFSALDGKELPW